MSLIHRLPREVIEHILLFLTSEDIYAFCETSDAELSASFWKKICLRDGVVNREEEKEILDSTKWKEEYFAYLNWKKGNFDHQLFPCVNQPVKIHKSNVFIPFDEKFNVFNMADDPRFLDDLPTKKMFTFGAYIVLVRGNTVTIYRYCHDKYSHYKTLIVQNTLFEIVDDGSSECNYNSKNEISVAMNENYLATYQHKFKLLSIFNLEESTVTHFETECSFLLTLDIYFNTVYALLLKCNKYILSKFNLTSENWEDSVVISQNAAGILVPKLKYNENIIVSLITFFVSTYNTLKIKNRDGESLSIVLINDNFHWFCLENNYVIYPSATSVIKVWNYDKPETTTEMNVDGGFKTGSTAPGCVLVVVYEQWLDVYNYRGCCKLYRIEFSVTKVKTLISKWYCVLSGTEAKCFSVLDFKKGKQKNCYKKPDSSFKVQVVF